MNLRLRAWLAQWGPMLPLLIAEAVVWIGFGALLPILPIYFVQNGVDLPTLGVVVAAWPAARVVAEPVFGWVADRGSRRLMMITGLLAAAVFAVMPLFWVGPMAFIVARLLAGVAAAMYDPAARGYLVDANPPEKRGEAFGLYNAAQMGGFMTGPAIGGIAAAIAGSPTIVFWVAGIALVASALLVALRVPELAHVRESVDPDPGPDPDPDVLVAAVPRPRRLVNRLLLAGVALNVGSYFAGGSYEVVWSLYMTSLGASIGMIGVSFFSFSLPVLLLSAYFGKLTDRSGGFWMMVLGLLVVGLCGVVYILVPQVWFVVAVGLVEGTAAAIASPALYLLVARASPVGRSSTAQGIFGAAGTVGTIIAALAAGALAQVDLRLPYVATTVGIVLSLGVGLLIGRRRLYDAMQPAHRKSESAP